MKIITNLVKILFGLVILCSTSICCYAAEAATATMTVQQSFVDLDGAPYASEAEVTYILSADAPESPMPSGSENGQYSFSLKGNVTGSTAPISFEHAGIFDYELRASIPDSFPYKCSPQVFSIQVYVNNDGSSLMVIHNQDQTKVAEMSAVYISPTRKPINNGNGHGTSKRVYSTTVRTGDSNDIILWIVLCIMSLIGIIILIVKKRK